LLENVNVAAFAGVHGGSYVALAGLDTAQVQFDQIPQVCGGRISDPTGTFHTLMRSESFDTQSLLSICNRGAGGMIVTTLDVDVLKQWMVSIDDNEILVCHRVIPLVSHCDVHAKW
jgi:hypothetical protein